MPIEEVVLEQTDARLYLVRGYRGRSIGIREFCSVYPYGLNDNVRGVGNVLKSDERLIVYTLFNKGKRKFRKLYYRERKERLM